MYLQSVRRDSRREKAKDLSALTYKGHIKQAHKQQISHRLRETMENMKSMYALVCVTQNTNETITRNILKIAKEVVPLAPRVINGHIRYDKDEELNRVKAEQKRIRRKYMDMPRRHKARREEYREQWRAASARIKMRVKAIREERLEAAAKQLEEAVGSDKQFRTVKKLAAQLE